MRKYKICVYAICKNEEKFVDRWYNSMKEADEIFVLDTGSTDKTVELLKNYPINLAIKEIKPWRFDIARNEALKLIPDKFDICVATDLDEVFKPGWRKEIEKVWKPNTKRLHYIYNWSLDENNKPIISFLSEKIHARKDYKWINPVHEVLKYEGHDEVIAKNEKIILNHYPDSNKSRSSYLPLLELAVKENPNNDRNTHYLGREYMYYEKWNECIDTLIKHLSLDNATWKDERSASMRFIARAYQKLRRFEEARMWLKKAITEAPHLRDPYLEEALFEYQLNNWEDVEYYCKKALEINEHELTYINETFSWDETVYDLLSLSTYYQNRLDESLVWLKKAIEMNPNNKRLQNNMRIIKESLK